MLPLVHRCPPTRGAQVLKGLLLLIALDGAQDGWAGEVSGKNQLRGTLWAKSVTGRRAPFEAATVKESTAANWEAGYTEEGPQRRAPQPRHESRSQGQRHVITSWESKQPSLGSKQPLLGFIRHNQKGPLGPASQEPCEKGCSGMPLHSTEFPSLLTTPQGPRASWLDPVPSGQVAATGTPCIRRLRGITSP